MHSSDPADQLKEQMQTGAACTQCHDQPEFTSEVETHTHHQADSSGSNCLNCHMPHTTYALLGAIRNHQIGSPNVRASAKHGTPNACNLCHLDKTLDWTQNQMASWYGHEKYSLSADDVEVAASLIWLLRGDAAQRSIAAWHFGWEPATSVSGDRWIAPFLANLLDDPYGVVRYVSHASLTRLPGFDGFQFDFLSDPRSRQEAILNAVQTWKATAVNSQNGSAILINADGQLDETKLRRLLENRDNRPVTIKE
jgi:hypothetical protein